LEIEREEKLKQIEEERWQQRDDLARKLYDELSGTEREALTKKYAEEIKNSERYKEKDFSLSFIQKLFDSEVRDYVRKMLLEQYEKQPTESQ
jgi:hypothetical protein